MGHTQPVGGVGQNARVTQRRTGRRIKEILLVLVLVAMINLPMVDRLVRDARLAASGVDVTGTVGTVEVDEHDRHLVTYRIPSGHDLETGPYVVSVHPDAAAEAEETGEIDVRILPGDGVTRSVEGEVRGGVGVVLTLLGNGVLLAIVALVIWLRRRQRDEPDEEPGSDADLDSGHDPEPR